MRHFNEYTDPSLMHFGVKGMKWGVRRSKSSVDVVDAKTGVKSTIKYDPRHATISKGADGSVKVKATSVKELGNIKKQVPANHAADFVRAQEILRKQPQQMSNEELRHLTQRLQLEKQYKDLNPSTVKKGYKVAKGVLDVSKTIISFKNLATHPLTKQVGSALASAAASTGDPNKATRKIVERAVMDRSTR